MVFLEKGKFFTNGHRKCLVGHEFVCMGVWQYSVIWVNAKGHITGNDCLYFYQPDNWSEIPPIKIRRKDKDEVESVLSVPIGFYSGTNTNSQPIKPDPNIIEQYLI